jgi:hypothetical protein
VAQKFKQLLRKTLEINVFQAFSILPNPEIYGIA